MKFKKHCGNSISGNFQSRRISNPDSDSELKPTTES